MVALMILLLLAVYFFLINMPSNRLLPAATSLEITAAVVRVCLLQQYVTANKGQESVHILLL
jgi:hypothetical protein